jgi:putative membrane protein
VLTLANAPLAPAISGMSHDSPDLEAGSPANDQHATDAPRPRSWLASPAQRERRLEQIGTPPDPRFTWANERTFLAWNRTALALIAAGLAAAQFLHFSPHGLRLIVAVPLIVLGGVLAFASYLQWEDSEKAIRLKEPLRYSWMPRVLTGGIVIVALCGGILAIIDRILH